MRPVSRKTWTRGPLPQFVEWARVGSSALLFELAAKAFSSKTARRPTLSVVGTPSSLQAVRGAELFVMQYAL